MGQRCDICIDPMCDGKNNCDCTTCSRANHCHRDFKPTIRFTNRCTQKCKHCCFLSSPDCNIEMSVEMSVTINTFLIANGIHQSNVMGGEFFCHHDWKTIMHNLGQGLDDVRVVSNSDWAGDPAIAGEVIEFFKAHPNHRLSLSSDRYHTNAHVDAAVALLEEAGIPFNVATEEENDSESIVPVGRSMYESASFYGSMACYCHNPLKKYHFLIDEEGKIYKCGFGVWNYTDVEDHLDGGFGARFKEFNQKFYDVFISSCRSCYGMCPPESRVKLRDPK